MNCAVTWGKALEFVTMSEECAICYNEPEEAEEGVKHPSDCDGEHVFCITCTKRLYWPGRFVDDDASLNSEEELAVENSSSSTCPLCRKETVPDWVSGKGKWSPSSLESKAVAERRAKLLATSATT